MRARTLTEAQVTAWMRHAGFSEEQIAAEMAAHEQRSARPRIAKLMAKAGYRALCWHRNRRAVDAMYQWVDAHPGLTGQGDQGDG